MIEKIKNYLKEHFSNRIFIACIMISVAILIVSTVMWNNRTFSVKSLSQLIYHMHVPMSGTDTGVYTDYVLKAFLPAAIVFVGLWIGYKHILGKYFLKAKEVVRKYLFKLGILSLCGALVYTLVTFKVINYISYFSDSSNLYETYYVDPENVDITFPSTKRNLIYIFMESMEATYSDIEDGGGFSTNYIPNLTKLAKNNINFSNSSKIGGALTVDGTQWTIASEISQTSGVPVTLPLNSEDYDEDSYFFSGAYTLGDVLEANGYRNYYRNGADVHFACAYNYFTQHGNYTLHDYTYSLKNHQLPSDDYEVFWGYEDEKLFELAKKDLMEISESDEPFNYTMLTVDTHTPDGYQCDLCDNKYKDKYFNSISCSDRQVYAFIEWLEQQDFYDNTTIVIVGDHKSMANKHFKEVSDDYVRTPYNCIINSQATTNNTKRRQFNEMDMYPTVLAALGCKIDGDRLGLGTNLFSSKETLCEKFGFELYNDKIQTHSDYYDKYILEQTSATNGDSKADE